MEPALQSTFLMGLFLLPCSHSQGVAGTTDGSKPLQPVVIGLTAVMCFLFVIFVANLVNRLFCYGKKNSEETPESNAEPRAFSNVYENIAMEAEEGNSKAPESKEEAHKQTNL